MLSNENEVLQFDSARLLTHWGIDEGFDTLVLMFEKRKTEGMIDHRLHGYDDTDRHILSAFISYWASKAGQSQQKGDDARQKIFPSIARIIRKASSADFSISELFWLVTKMQFIEYVPLVKEYLQHIIDHPSKRYWEIHDTVKSLLEIEPQFIMIYLRVNTKSYRTLDYKKNIVNK